MTEFLARLDDWSDRLSPIVVKEVRQMVRGREFTYSFGISLIAGLLVAFFGLGDALTATGATGARVFSALMVCLGLLGVGVVPMGTFSALRNERADQTLDLITQTSLTPRSIVFGKLMTQWIKLLTLFAGLAPFITISFLLGGIDLQTILISLAMLFMWSMWVCAACLFLSAASQSRAMSAAVFVALGIAILSVLGSFSSLLFMLMFGGPGGIPRFTMSEFGWPLAASTGICFVSMTNFVLLAENRLSLPIEDRSTALRVGFFVQYLLILACIVGPFIGGAAYYTGSDVIEVLVVVGGIHLAITSIFAVTEDMEVSRRVFRRVRKSLRWPWFAIFRPGGGRGAAWILTQMLITLTIAFLVGGSDQEFRWLLATCCYIVFFTGVPTAILRQMFNGSIRTAYVRGAILLFFPIVAVSADVFQYFIAPGSIFAEGFSAYHILNPFRTLTDWPKVEAAGWHVGAFLMGLVGLLAYADLYRMNRREDKYAARSN
jgi:hypothetical protein